MKNQELLKNIKHLCKENDVTIANLEKELDIGAGTISRWNKATPTFDKILSIAKYFRVSIDELCGYDIKTARNMIIDSVGEETKGVILYLINATENNEIVWGNCSESEIEELREIDKKLKKIKSFDISKILYSCDEDGYYLFNVAYDLNEMFDYETKLYLYLLPDEKSEPVLETSCNDILRNLLIKVMSQINDLHKRQDSKQKAQKQREKIYIKYKQNLGNHDI